MRWAAAAAAAARKATSAEACSATATLFSGKPVHPWCAKGAMMWCAPPPQVLARVFA